MNEPHRPLTAFETEIEHAINYCSMENGSDTPDFILACYLASCLEAFNAASRAREKWYGKALGVGGVRDLNEPEIVLRGPAPEPMR